MPLAFLPSLYLRSLDLLPAFFSALSHTHTHTHTHWHTSSKADGCNTVAGREREGGSLALNNTGTWSDSLMEWSGWGWTWVGDAGEMWCQYPRSCSHWPRAFLPLFGPFIPLFYLQGGGWRVLGRRAVGKPRLGWWGTLETEPTISKCSSGTGHTKYPANIHIKSKSGCKIEEKGSLF